MIQRTDIGRHCGLTWTIEFEQHEWLPHGEFLFVSNERNANGAEYVIIHDWEVGDFQLIEMGGDIANPWDWPHGYFRTPLQAMRHARRDFLKEAERARLEAEEMEAWSQDIDIAEARL